MSFARLSPVTALDARHADEQAAVNSSSGSDEKMNAIYSGAGSISITASHYQTAISHPHR